MNNGFRTIKIEIGPEGVKGIGDALTQRLMADVRESCHAIMVEAVEQHRQQMHRRMVMRSLRARARKPNRKCNRNW